MTGQTNKLFSRPQAEVEQAGWRPTDDTKRITRSVPSNIKVKIWALHKARVLLPMVAGYRAAARALTLETACRGIVDWDPEPTSSGGVRIICRLEANLNAMHYVIARIVEAHTPPSPINYSQCGTSHRKLALDIKAKPNDG